MRILTMAVVLSSIAGCSTVARKPTAELCMSAASCGRQCDGGDALSCHSLATIYAVGDGVAQNRELASIYFRRACQMDEMAGCAELGDAYLLGIGVPQSDFQAFALYEKACEGGLPIGCRNLADLYRAGVGMKRDSDKALGLYDVACDAGERRSCHSSAELHHARGEKLLAAQRVQRGCELEHAVSCRALAGMLDRGEGLAKDAAFAELLYRKACRLGDATACTTLTDKNLAAACVLGSEWACRRLEGKSVERR